MEDNNTTPSPDYSFVKLVEDEELVVRPSEKPDRIREYITSL